MALQPFDIGVAAQEPQQFIDDRFQMHLFGGDQREARRQVVAELMAEQAAGAGSGAIGLVRALLENQAQQVLVRGRDRHVGQLTGG